MPLGNRTTFTVTVDTVVFALHEGELVVLMIKRGRDPFQGAWALPGGFVEADETLEEAALRELEEETGIRTTMARQFAAYGRPGRDPRGRVVTVAHLSALPAAFTPTAATDAAHAQWLPAYALVRGRRRIAFDHRQILREAIEALKGRLAATTIATAFCPPEFTLTQLRQVYEVVLEQPLDPGNFQRKMRSTEDFIVDTGERRRVPGGRGRPASLFRAEPPGIHLLSNPMARR